MNSYFKWRFKKLEPGTPERNPHETEFFRSTPSTGAVIREFIQNSIDARYKNQKVRIRIALGKTTYNDASIFFRDLSHHLNSPEIRLSFPNQEIRFLVLEDFGTHGLTGNIDPAKSDGDFYNFWWREGISQKTGRKAGRWGLGKTTFFMVSGIRTCFGLSISSDKNNAEYLMGKALLKVHTADRQKYDYYGYLCTDSYFPIDDRDYISTFKRCFKVSRKQNETGFSIIIPCIEHEFDFNSIIRESIRHYYLPILEGWLEIYVEDDRGYRENISRSSILDVSRRIDWAKTDWEHYDVSDILNDISSLIDIDRPISIHIANKDRPKLQPEYLKSYKDEFIEGKPLKFRIPLQIIERNKGPKDSYVDILIQRQPKLKRPFEAYIRSGITIIDIKKIQRHPVIACLLAHDEIISKFLGDCETPAHTDWNERTEGFKQKYSNATQILRFVKNCLRDIVMILDEPVREIQRDFLKDIFSLSNLKSKNIQGGSSIGGVIIPNTDEQIFTIDRLRNGFKITFNKNHPKYPPLRPMTLEIRAAYDVRRGDPFSHYHPFDFEFSDSNTIHMICEGCRIISCKKNSIKIVIPNKISHQADSFKLMMWGFDENRDLVIKIKEIDKGQK